MLQLSVYIYYRLLKILLCRSASSSISGDIPKPEFFYLKSSITRKIPLL